MYAAGNFKSIGGQARNRVAALDVETGAAQAWNPNPDGDVIDLALSGTKVYAGGRFTSIGGQARNRIAALDAATSDATAWNPNANGAVYAVAVSGATVYVGGQFTSIGGQARNNLAALDAATGLATAWNPNVGGYDAHVYAIAVSGTAVYVGGDFTTVGGEWWPYFAQFDAVEPTAARDWMLHE